MSTKPNRTSEYDYSVTVLRYLAEHPTGEESVTVIKRNMPSLMELTDGDLEPSGTRPNELVYQQIVGNIVSHRFDSDDNFIARGLLSHRPRYLSITDAGRQFIEKWKKSS